MDTRALVGLVFLVILIVFGIISTGEIVGPDSFYSDTYINHLAAMEIIYANSFLTCISIVYKLATYAMVFEIIYLIKRRKNKMD